MKKLLNYALLLSFALTVFVPITGVHLHKVASTLFLQLCAVHTLVYRKQLQVKRYLLIALVLACYLTDVLGMIFDEIALLLTMHKVLSILSIFFLAIHIFVFHKKMR